MREITLMRKLDKCGAITFVDVISTTDHCPADRATLLARFHAEEDGRLLSGAAAFAAIWRAIPILRPVGLVARNQQVLAMLERAYIFFLRHRPKLKRFVNWIEKKQV
jgi:predicted DCC family thiol-disulfide oxidoreductase YuxK